MTRFKPSMVEIKRRKARRRRRSGTCICTTSSGCRPAGERWRRARRRRSRCCRRATASGWTRRPTGASCRCSTTSPPEPGRQVYLTWQIDWVPQTEPARTDISRIHGTFMDVANGGAYPVFDAERALRSRTVTASSPSPTEVSTDPADPSNEELGKISPAATWTVPSTLHRWDHPALGRRPPPSRRPLRRPGGRARRTRRRDDRRRRSGRGQAALPLRRQVLRARGGGELGRRDDRRPARLEGASRARRHRLDRRHLRRQAGRRGTRGWGSSRSAGPRTPTRTPGIRSWTRRRCERCTSRAARSPTVDCRRTSTPMPARTWSSPTRASCRAGGPAPARRRRHRQLHLRVRRLLGGARLPGRSHAPAGHPAGRAP